MGAFLVLFRRLCSGRLGGTSGRRSGIERRVDGKERECGTKAGQYVFDVCCAQHRVLAPPIKSLKHRSLSVRVCAVEFETTN